MRPFRSANFRVLWGSAVLAMAAGGFGGACAAQPADDAAAQPAGYHGPYLTWAGKTASPGRQPDAVAPAASSSEFAAWPAPAPGAPRLRPVAYVAPAHAAAPKPSAVAAYVAPRRVYTPKASVAAAPMPVPMPSQAAAYVAPPAQALPQNDTAAAAPAANPLGQTGVHYYSLHREYGLTPDQVQTPKDRPMVLIGPPDTPPSQKPDDAGDGADKHGAADGADD